MCLIAWRWQPDCRTPFLVLANRDEFYARPSRAMHWWREADILAGQDLLAGGTWLGLSGSGKFAALTNYREPSSFRSDAPSRGALVSDFLRGDRTVADYLATLSPRAQAYNPFNLLLKDDTVFMGFESRHARSFAIAPGIGAVSNSDFDTPWPKLTRLKHEMALAQGQSVSEPEVLFGLLKNRRIATDTELPATGLPIERERQLSAAFIQTPDYGTRASTVVRQTGERSDVWERGFNEVGVLSDTHFRF